MQKSTHVIIGVLAIIAVLATTTAMVQQNQNPQAQQKSLPKMPLDSTQKEAPKEVERGHMVKNFYAIRFEKGQWERFSPDANTCFIYKASRYDEWIPLWCPDANTCFIYKAKQDNVTLEITDPTDVWYLTLQEGIAHPSRFTLCLKCKAR